MIMAYEVRDMCGSVFKNKRKDKDTSPALTGTGMIFGREVWINAWVKVDKNGDKWISFAFKEKDSKGDPSTKSSKELTDDDIPF